MRLPFLLGFAEGLAAKIIRSINAADYVPAGTVDGQNYPAITIALGGSINTFLFHFLQGGVSLPLRSASVSGKWDVVFLLPADSLDYRRGPALYRAMRRLILSPKNRVEGIYTADENGAPVLIAAEGYYLFGPWSINRVAATYPSFAEAHFSVRDGDGNSTGILQSPIMISGDPSPIDVAKVDYPPTDQECIDDVDPVESDLVGAISR